MLRMGSFRASRSVMGDGMLEGRVVHLSEAFAGVVRVLFGVLGFLGALF